MEQSNECWKLQFYFQGNIDIGKKPPNKQTKILITNLFEHLLNTWLNEWWNESEKSTIVLVNCENVSTALINLQIFCDFSMEIRIFVLVKGQGYEIDCA